MEAVSPGSAPDPDPSSQGGVSLDELAQAFAQVMGIPPRPGGSDAPAAPAEASTVAVDAGVASAAGPSAATEKGEEPLAGEADAAGTAGPLSAEAKLRQEASGPLPAGDIDIAEVEDSCPITPQSILEAMLFVGDRENRPLSGSRAAELMRGVDPAEIAALVEGLNQRYLTQGCPYEIVHEAGGYRLTLGKSLSSLRDRFFGHLREARLSQAAIEVLAIIAYQQSRTADEISKLRGRPSGHVLSQLVHRGLLQIQRQPGKREAGRYCTTERFLHLFGLESLADLPQSEELDR